MTVMIEFDKQSIAELVRHMKLAHANDVELQVGSDCFHLHLPHNSFFAKEKADEGGGADFIRSLAVGRFTRQHPLHRMNAIEEGAPFDVGQLVGYICAGHILRPVCANSNGYLYKFLCKPGDFVSYGTPIAQIEGHHQ